jgi:hypothetical protein
MSSDAIDQSPNQDVSSLLSTLLSSPESLSKIGDIIAKHTKEENRDFSPPNQQNPQTASNISNNFDEIPHKSEDASTTSQNEIKEHTSENPLDFLSFLSSDKLSFLAIKDEQIALLLAIRPYLSEHRREVIDAFLKISKIAKIFSSTQ